MILEGFVGPAYLLDSVNVDAQRCINLYPETVESGSGKEAQRYYLRPTPGLRTLLSVGDGPIRCVHVDSIGRIFVVSGNQLYRIVQDTQMALVATSYTAVSVTQSSAVFPDGDVIAANSHGFYTGLKVQVSSSGTLPTGLSAATDYWVIVFDSNNIQLASSLANALSATVVDITAANSGTLTITPQIAPIVTKTFAQSGNVDLTTDFVLPGGSPTSPSGFVTGQKVRVSSDKLPSGLAEATDYYVIRVDGDNFKLATNITNASTATGINITNANTGTMSITPSDTYSQSWIASQGTVDTGAETIIIPFALAPITNPSLDLLYTGLKVQVSSSGTLPTGLSAATDYWLIKVDTITYKFASSLANAAAGTAINLTGAGSGNMTITAPTVASHTVNQASAVSASTDQINSVSHGYYTGLRIRVSGGSLPTGISEGVDYWMYAPDVYSVGFCASSIDSLAGALIDLTALGSQNMTMTAQTASTLTFDESDVNVTTNAITKTAHGLYTGLKVTFATLPSTPGGLAFLTDYFIIRVDADSFKLATSLSNASAGTALDITTLSGEWTLTLVGSNGLDGGEEKRFQTSAGVVKASSMSFLGKGTDSSTMFVDGNRAWWFQDNGGSSNFGTIAAFGSEEDVPSPQFIAWIDGYFIVNEGGTNTYWVSDISTFNFGGLSFASAEGSPDALLALIANQRNLILLGERTTELFVDTGNADFPFERVQGGFSEIGILAQFSAARIAGTVLWLGRSDEGQGIVYAATGLIPQRVSTYAIEQAISSYENPSNAVAFTYQMNGHNFYVLNFEEATWVYDLTEGLWHERAYLNNGSLERHRAQFHTFAPNEQMHIVGDYENSKIYEFDDSTNTDDDGAITRLRSSPHLSSDLDIVFHRKFQLDMETGIGLDGGIQGSDPTVMLDFSDDGGHTWSSQMFALADAGSGQIGEYKTRVIWRRLGRSRDRIYRVQITDPVKIRLLAAHIDVEKGVS